MNLSNLLTPASRRQNGAHENNEHAARIRPHFSVLEDKESFEVIVDLPGVTKQGLEVNAEQNQIVVVGRRNWNPPSDWSVLYRETAQANFGLTLDHQGNIDTEKIRAELKEGVLHLSLPKCEALKPRRIAIE
jgi:HSP20 family protein